MAVVASLVLPTYARVTVPQAPVASFPRRHPLLHPVPASPARWNSSRGRVFVSSSNRRAPTVRRSAAETVTPYVPGSGKYIAPDYLVKKVSAKEVEELVRGERKVPLIVDFYATWCGPCVQMAQDIEMAWSYGRKSRGGKC